MAKKIVLGIIAILSVSIILFTTFIIYSQRPVDIEAAISHLAEQYYENYFFPNLDSSIHAHGSASISETLSPYTTTGFSGVPLRQILTHTEHDSTTTQAITASCDDSATLVHFFPDPPFTSTSYHINYSYYCNF